MDKLSVLPIRLRQRRFQRRLFRRASVLLVVVLFGSILHYCFDPLGRSGNDTEEEHTTSLVYKYLQSANETAYQRTFSRPTPQAVSSNAGVSHDDAPVPIGTDSKARAIAQLKEHAHDMPPPQKDDMPVPLVKRRSTDWSVDDAARTKHRFSANGLLSVATDADAAHPVPELIAFAKRKWEKKLQRASRTLTEAVLEYERRYGRRPPKGFDKWWAYVEKHNVQLPDEYDQIHRDLEPFWGMSPKDLDRIVGEFEGHKDSFTFGKNPGSDIITMLKYSFNGDGEPPEELLDGLLGLIELLLDVEAEIPPFRAVLIPHDNPEHVFDWSTKRVALNHAAKGTYMDAFKSLIPQKHNGWISSCSPVSPAWAVPIDYTKPASPPTSKSFIFDHRKAMDPCQHPSILRQHGQFLPWRKGPAPKPHFIPSFSYSPSIAHQDITIAHQNAWRIKYREAEDPVWEDKRDDRLEWRGMSTGIYYGRGYEWELSHRIRMMDWAARGLQENVTLLEWRDDVKEKGKEGRGRGGEREVKILKSKLAKAALDIGFVYTPFDYCDEPACTQLMSLYPFEADPHHPKDTYRYKYILDVDGNGWSSRFHRLMESHSLVFKSTIYPEWWLDRVQEWVHYVPVQNDLSDLWDSLVWFRGGVEGEGRHDGAAREIATAGREWVRRYWRREDMTAYNYRLLLEYARIMSPDRNEMTYNHWELDSLFGDPVVSSLNLNE